jgi:predicted TIM-barrel fold metal-dependent hydrolase
VSGQPVFDFHARVAPVPDAGAGLLAAMDGAGVTRCGVAAGGVVGLDVLARQLVDGGHVEHDADNDAVLAACRSAAGRLVPFYFANPHRGPDHYARRAAEFRAVELSPAVHGVGLADPRVDELVAIAGQAGHPVYTVCLDRPGSTVADLVALARRHPGVPLVLGHCGVGLIDLHAIDLIAPLDDIVIETSGAFLVTVRIALSRLGRHRVLFSAEHPSQPPIVELAKYAAAGLSDEDWSHVAWRNANRILEGHS